MRAFVLGGGGNLGAMQVGALQALLEDEIRPDFLLGCSVGALNASMIAIDYSKKSLTQLAHLWKNVRVHDIFPGGKLSFAWRFLTQQDGLCSNQQLFNFLSRHGVCDQKTFSQVSDIPLYITATNLKTGQLDVFGHHDDERLIDALMATSAQPPLLPPWEVNGTQYVDGGTVTPLPLRTALDLGATEIYSLRIEHESTNSRKRQSTKPIRGMAGVVKRSVNMMVKQQAQYDLLLARHQPNITLHEIELCAPTVERSDFSCGDLLIEQGYEIMRAYLSYGSFRQPQPTLYTDFAKTDGGLPFSLGFPMANKELSPAGD